MTRLRLTNLLSTPPPIPGDRILLLGGLHHGRSLPMPVFPREFLVSDADRVLYSRDPSIEAGGAVAFPLNFGMRDKVAAVRAWLGQVVAEAEFDADVH